VTGTLLLFSPDNGANYRTPSVELVFCDSSRYDCTKDDFLDDPVVIGRIGVLVPVEVMNALLAWDVPGANPFIVISSSPCLGVGVYLPAITVIALHGYIGELSCVSLCNC